MEHRSPRTAAGGLSQRQGMGILFGVYLSFGLSPLYWNLLHGVSALEMVSHRSLWGSLIIAAFMVWKGQFPAFFRAIRIPVPAGPAPYPSTFRVTSHRRHRE
mgnify:CR=1 FL=1